MIHHLKCLAGVAAVIALLSVGAPSARAGAVAAGAPGTVAASAGWLR